VVHARSIHYKPSGWAGEVYQDVRHDGEEFEIADEPPIFRARELVLHGLAESVDHVQVSVEPMPDGFAKYHAWYAPGQNLYGKAATGPFKLVEWTGLSWHPGWPKEPCRLRLVVGNFDPLCYCYEGESIEGKLFRIELQRDPVLETSVSLQRERNKWIDRQILLDKQKAVAQAVPA
jgi:hypothetical protein